MQRSIAMGEKKNSQQKISQHNECKGNIRIARTRAQTMFQCLPIHPMSNRKVIGSRQTSSNDHKSQTDTPLLLPFP